MNRKRIPQRRDPTRFALNNQYDSRWLVGTEMGQAFAVVWKHPRREGRNVLATAPTQHHSQKRSSFLQQHAVVTKEEECLVQAYGEKHWRVSGYRFLHKHEVILALAALMVLDILFLIIDLVISANYPDCPMVLQNCECTANLSTFNLQTNPPTLSPSSETHSEDNVCRRTCVEPPIATEQTKLAMTIGSIVILTIFVLELVVHITIIGIKHFLHDLFLVIDFVIVIVSIVLEAIVLHMELTKNPEEEVAIQATTVPLLIVSRGWRLLRIGHGAYKEAHDFYGERIETLEMENQELKQRLSQFGKTSSSRGENKYNNNDARQLVSIANGIGSASTENNGLDPQEKNANHEDTIVIE